MQLVLKLASPPVARKRESKRAKQGELMVLPVATPAAPRKVRRKAESLFTVWNPKNVNEMAKLSKETTKVFKMVDLPVLVLTKTAKNHHAPIVLKVSSIE